MKRSEIDNRYKWDLSDVYGDIASWEADFAEIEASVTAFESFRGKLNEESCVLECLKLSDRINGVVEKLAVYAHMLRDEDTTIAATNSMYARVISLCSRLSTETAFIDPELSALPEETLRTYAKKAEFAPYDYFISRLIDGKPYILSEAEERILALTGDFSGEFDNIFTMIDNADLNLPTVTVDGAQVQLSHGMYAKLMQDSRQDVRKLVFEAYYSAFEKLKNTLAANYYGEVKKDIFYARARGYKTYLDKVMRSEDVPVAVYDRLIAAVNAHLGELGDYLALRKKMLGVDNLYMYDLYTPIVPNAEISVEYDEACAIVERALAPMGEEYLSHIRDAFKDGWIDVYETDGKRSGGYCTHAYMAPHPYVLLNYSKTTHDVFTLAHELGHAMHSYYSSHAQPISKADYKIFVAEVASTVNEMLLLDHLLKTTQDVNVKKFLLSYRLDTIRTTIYRQTMFSEFERETHERTERNEPLTMEGLAQLYGELNARYYRGVSKDEHICYEWSRIPHFYYSFYVYKYATGLTAAINISERILKQEVGFAQVYAKFLSAGGSKSPYEILCDCGVDLATEEPYEHVFELFRSTVEELQKLSV